MFEQFKSLNNYSPHLLRLVHVAYKNCNWNGTQSGHALFIMAFVP